MLPEEIELSRLEAEQAAVKEEVASAELDLETTRTETAQFQQRYYQTIGRLYAQLDDLDAKIAKALSEQSPSDNTLNARSQSAKRQAEQSAEEAGLIEAQPKLPPSISPDLKRAYYQAAKLMHPDLALTEHERQRRNALMASANLAYKCGDQSAIEKLIQEFGEDPEAIVGEDVASRLVKTIRRIAQLRRRLRELQIEMENLQKTTISILRKKAEEAEAIGDTPLDDLAKALLQQISDRTVRLEDIRLRKGRVST
jgi:hypothetical protein